MIYNELNIFEKKENIDTGRLILIYPHNHIRKKNV